MPIEEGIQNGRDCFAAILAYAHGVEESTWDAAALVGVIEPFRRLPIQSEWWGLIEQLRVNEGIHTDANAGWRDLRPDLNTYAKRKLLLWAMEEFDAKQEKTTFFEWYLRFIKVGETRYEVEEICSRYYDFIIYKILGKLAFIVSEMRHQSFVMTSVEYMATPAEVRSILVDPRWQGELTWHKHASLGPAYFEILS